MDSPKHSVSVAAVITDDHNRALSYSTSRTAGTSASMPT